MAFDSTRSAEVTGVLLASSTLRGSIWSIETSHVFYRPLKIDLCRYFQMTMNIPNSYPVVTPMRAYRVNPLNAPRFGHADRPDGNSPQGSIAYTTGTAVGGMLVGGTIGAVIGYFVPNLRVLTMAGLGAVWGFAMSGFPEARKNGPPQNAEPRNSTQNPD